MISDKKMIEEDFLQNEEVLCIFTDQNGVITNIGNGMKRYFPCALNEEENIWANFDVDSFIDEMTENFQNKKHDYYLTPKFNLNGFAFRLLCIPCQYGNARILHILCPLRIERVDTKSRRTYRKTMENYRNQQLAKLDAICAAESIDPKRLRAVNDSLQRSEALLSILNNFKQIGSDESFILLSDFCEELNYRFSLLRNQLGRGIVLRYPEESFYLRLDTVRFLEALASMVSIHELYAPALALELRISHECIQTKKGSKDEFRLAAESKTEKEELGPEESVLFDALKGVLEDFGEYYKATGFYNIVNGTLITEMRFFPLLVSPQDIDSNSSLLDTGDEVFMSDKRSRSRKLEQFLPLLRHNSIERTEKA